ncbi:hypothetical protein Hanom_Chr08g00722451 [Helianthus anomalus]
MSYLKENITILIHSNITIITRLWGIGPAMLMPTNHVHTHSFRGGPHVHR